MSTIINEDTRHDAGVPHTPSTRLKFLEDLSGYRVHHDDIDPRGYNVKLRSGKSIGQVEGLLADTSAKVVRYLEVEVDDDVITRHNSSLYDRNDRHALVPIGIAHIDEDSKSVILAGISTDQIVDYPRFRKDRGYTSRYELDTNDYLSGFHDFGSTYNRELYSTDVHRGSDRLDDAFYDSDFYSTRSSRSTR